MKVPFLSFYDIFSLASSGISRGQQLTPRVDREGPRPTGDAGPSEPDGKLILVFSWFGCVVEPLL